MEWFWFWYVCKHTVARHSSCHIKMSIDRLNIQNLQKTIVLLNLNNSSNRRRARLVIGITIGFFFLMWSCASLMFNDFYIIKVYLEQGTEIMMWPLILQFLMFRLLNMRSIDLVSQRDPVVLVCNRRGSSRIEPNAYWMSNSMRVRIEWYWSTTRTTNRKKKVLRELP